MPGTKTQIGTREYTPGAIIAGKYRLLHRLGQGGMGSIWAAHNPTLDINLAIKLIRIETASDDAHARLLQEARATARLADPAIVRIFDIGHTEQGDPFITMELLTGTNLRQALDGGPLDPVRAVRTLLPIARALECAHRAGIVHRDVKPDNIVLAVGTRGDLQPKLVDFGVAKILTRPNHLTSVGAAVGSPLYMSPEQARGEPIDARTDLWSLCVVLYETIMGAPPFDAVNSNALLHAISTQPAPTIAGRGSCDEALSRIIDRGLNKERDQRWLHARDLMLALAEWLRSHGVMDDITGLSLRGRGVGRRSSLPASSLPAGFEVSRERPRGRPYATVVNLLGGAPSSAAATKRDPEGSDALSAALEATSVSEVPDRRTRTLLWAALGFIALALAVLGLAFVRGAPPVDRAQPLAAPVSPPDPAPSATPPPTGASGAADAPAASAAKPASPTSASTEDATRKRRSDDGRRPSAASSERDSRPVAPPAGRSSTRSGEKPASKAAPRAKPTKTPRARDAFKNPFE